MHVLLLPKWYPGTRDPQLGDFIRKQALAAGAYVRMSVLHVEAWPGMATPQEAVLRDGDGAWELTVSYRASSLGFGPLRKIVNFSRYWSASLHGWQRVVLERGTPNLVHAYILVRPALFAWWIGRRFGVPYLISEQSSEYLDGTYTRKSTLFHVLNRMLFRKARVVTAVSSVLGEALKGHRLCSAYTVVPNVVPGLDRPLPAPGAHGHFLVVADLVDRTKNVSGVLRALALARRQDEKAHLSIIGDGPDRQMLELLTEHLGLQGAVRFHGRLPNSEVLDHMAEAFAVIINSNVETFSVVTGEALAQGKPVIATKCGGPQAFVTSANGVLIGTQDDEALAQAMLSFLSKPAEFDPAAIRSTVHEQFSAAAVGQAFRSTYSHCLA